VRACMRVCPRARAFGGVRVCVYGCACVQIRPITEHNFTTVKLYAIIVKYCPYIVRRNHGNRLNIKVNNNAYTKNTFGHHFLTEHCRDSVGGGVGGGVCG
jgi:hypothetical protein